METSFIKAEKKKPPYRILTAEEYDNESESAEDGNWDYSKTENTLTIIIQAAYVSMHYLRYCMKLATAYNYFVQAFNQALADGVFTSSIFGGRTNDALTAPFEEWTKESGCAYFTDFSTGKKTLVEKWGIEEDGMWQKFNGYYDAEYGCLSYDSSADGVQWIFFGAPLNKNIEGGAEKPPNLEENKLNLINTKNTPLVKVGDSSKEYELRLIHENIAAAQEHLTDLPVEELRGLTLDTLQHFHCGFIEKHIAPKNVAEFKFGLRDKLPQRSRRLIIPTADGNHYNAVALRADRPKIDKAYWKVHAGDKYPFNLDSLSAEKINLIVEGEICAMSIYQATSGKVPVIATEGAGVGDSLLKPLVYNSAQFPEKPQFLILFDSDEQGKTAAPKLQEKLLKVGFTAAIDFLYPNDITNTDFNDVLCTGGDERLAEIIQEMLEAAPPKFEKAAAEIKLKTTPARTYYSENISAPAELTREQAVYCFNFIDAKNFNHDDWFHCLTALKDAGLSAAEADSLSVGGRNYKPGVVAAKWCSLDPAAYPAPRLFQWAKNQGADLTAFQRQWYKDHPQYGKPLAQDSEKDAEKAAQQFYHKGEQNVPKDANDILRTEGGDAVARRLNEMKRNFEANREKLEEEARNAKAAADAEKAAAEKVAVDKEIDSLSQELEVAKEKLSDFEAEKKSAIESLQSINPADSETALAETVIKAAAFAKNYSMTDYHAFYDKVKNGGAVNLLIWRSAVTSAAKALKAREFELKAAVNRKTAALETKKYTAADNDLKNFIIPYGYSVTDKGVSTLDKQGQFETICPQPLYISAKYYGVDTSFFKWNLKFTLAGKKKEIAAVAQATLADSSKIISAVANYGLLVDSTNANSIVKYLTAFSAANEKKFPVIYTLKQLGWHNFNGADIFLDPRRNCEVEVDGVKSSLVADSQNWLTEHLKTAGSLQEWKRAYDLTKNCPVARFIVAAALTAPLLKILGLRSFAVYVFGSSRAGKSTALLLATSAVGGEGLKLTFNGTSNGLLAAAIEAKDYPFFLDEKQAATTNLSENLHQVIYTYCEETGRIRAARDGSLRQPRHSKGVLIANGESQLFFEGVTEGALTRTLQLAISGELLSGEICEAIRQTIKNNYGHILPLFLDKLLTLNVENLREDLKKVTADFVSKNQDILPEYCADVAAVTLAYRIFESLFKTDKEIVRQEAAQIAAEVFKLLPTKNAISDFERAKDIILGFIVQKARCFINSPLYKEGELPPADLFGRFSEDFIFLTGAGFNLLCNNAKIDTEKTKKICADNGFFLKSTEGGKETIYGVAAITKGLKKRCYRIPHRFIEGAEFEIDPTADADDVNVPF